MNIDRIAAIRSRPWTGLYFIIAIAVIFLARSVVMPVAMAILVTFLLGPLVSRLTRLFRSRAAAVSVVSVLLLGATASLLLVVWGQMFELADNLPAYQEKITKKIHDLHGGTTSMRSVVIACIPSRDGCDHVASQLFAQVLEAEGLKTRVVSPTTLLGETLELIEEEKIPVLLVSSVQPGGAARTRLVCKAIRRRFPDASLIVGAWGSEQIRVTSDKPEAVEGATAVYRKASDVLRELRALVPFMAVKTEEASAAKAPPAVAESSCGRAGSPTLCSI